MQRRLAQYKRKQRWIKERENEKEKRVEKSGKVTNTLKETDYQRHLYQRDNNFMHDCWKDLENGCI